MMAALSAAWSSLCASACAVVNTAKPTAPATPSASANGFGAACSSGVKAAPNTSRWKLALFCVLKEGGAGGDLEGSLGGKFAGRGRELAARDGRRSAEDTDGHDLEDRYIRWSGGRVKTNVSPTEPTVLYNP
jgi:hypothetical protein